MSERRTFKIDENVLKILDKYCNENGKIKSFVVEKAIKRYLEHEGEWRDEQKTISGSLI